MSEFINTADVLGDDVVVDSIINRTITEYKDDRVKELGSNAFYGCVCLETVDLPNATQIGTETFTKCSKLTSVNFPKVKYADRSFIDVNALTHVCFPSMTSTGWQGLTSMKGLLVADLPVITRINRGAFAYCFKLIAVILRNTAGVAGMDHSDAFNSTPIKDGTGYIYVPSALVADYKAATNWSTYADQIRALEDYTVDGTTTGELDETKI